MWVTGMNHIDGLSPWNRSGRERSQGSREVRGKQGRRGGGKGGRWAEQRLRPQSTGTEETGSEMLQVQVDTDWLEDECN